ncbi:Rieske [2Fe-2S] domain protein [Hoeflea phototrophica DFL-43]|jgi:nitrite reductase/ring-hydroxylating ferredoxin subunit|uniref:Rieske [2Fe-2S] domain protein n=1 Tax=Hoeflea phototrophica (strain DSM 17068 / NCIMB 14078 / DFL-43) TaxID=411684 RepID=A9D2Q7_HOEPD|nr:Rieske 2Fe-2S domain-containing protein [Hoeflea phototrophica]EDQ34253.2 Rieske [2Fe-2S] domain protein [Hoeflea phototrophica DFL-43]
MQVYLTDMWCIGMVRCFLRQVRVGFSVFFPNPDCQWVPVALSNDVRPASVAPIRTVQGAAALWRSASGKLSACADRCPHRGMRLSHGFVRGEALSCIYHGWSYGLSGQCVRIPAHPDLTPPTAIKVETQTAAEVGGVIWVSRDAADTPPPHIAGYEPLRSITVMASPDQIRSSVDEAREEGLALGCMLGGIAARVLCVDQGDGATLVHILIGPDATLAERIAVSRSAEALRRAAEALADKEPCS